MPPSNPTPASPFLFRRWPALVACADWLRKAKSVAVDAPLETVQHASRWRIRWIGLFTLIGHPLFFWIWGVWLPQPWESLWLRLAAGLLGAPLVLDLWMADVGSRRTQWLFGLICWLTLPVLFSWMYLCNSGNTVWLSSMVAMVLIYYRATDWRLATLGTATGGLLAWLLFLVFGPEVPEITGVQLKIDAVVIGFSWATALVLGFSTANMRREQLQQTLATMGIMAHELRTPLATVSLIGEAMQAQARALPGTPAEAKLDQLSNRLHGLVRNMNHQIDTQIVNARLLSLPAHAEEITAGDLLRECVENFPYRNQRERQCVVLHVRRDFRFKGSQSLFSQVIDNLLKNALKALAATDAAAEPGDLMVEVGILQNRGRILIADHGIGISPELQRRIFEPFYSTDHGSGHGLGLTFCKRVVHSANGAIRVQSEPGKGATFTIELPLLP
ncbi:MAG TPA: HAMP domain-containing sensor histidine kinase [Burkholderiaceae bacterium]|nr:HAMP domain-containing sensor histidine kinase [Burkholderiaceae bacterium]